MDVVRSKQPEDLVPVPQGECGAWQDQRVVREELKLFMDVKGGNGSVWGYEGIKGLRCWQSADCTNRREMEKRMLGNECDTHAKDGVVKFMKPVLTL
jgi:hypothetical protein